MTSTPPEPEPGVDDPALWQQPPAELITVAAPMTAKLRELGGRYVVLHIIGGMQVDGSISELDEDDGTVTLEERGRKTHVALHAIAVLAPGGPR